MSDLFENNASLTAADDAQEPTRTMQTVESGIVRHRRAGRNAAAKPEAAEESVSILPESAEKQAEAPSFGQAIRIPPKEEPSQATSAARAAFDQAAPAPAPRPRALDRAEGDPRSQLRRPVNAPGYTQQTPLGKSYDVPTPRGQSADRTRKPQAAVTEETEEKAGVTRILIIIVIVLLLIAALVLGYHLIDENSENALGAIKRSIAQTLGGTSQMDPVTTDAPRTVSRATDFTADQVSEYAPSDITFYLETDGAVEDVRLVDADGQVLEGMVYRDELEDGSIEWGIQTTFEAPYWGTVRAQILTEEWEDTGLSRQVSVLEETIKETSTVAPTLQVVNEILDFSASPASGTAPVNIAFSMTTSLNITQVRLVDEDGEALDAEASILVDNASTRIWALNHTFDRAYNGVVRAQANIDGAWLDSNKLVSLSVQGASATAAPVVVPVGEGEQNAEQAVSINVPLNDEEGVYDMPDDWDDGEDLVVDDAEDALDAIDAFDAIDVYDEGVNDAFDDLPDDLIVEETVEESQAAATQAPLVNNALAALPLEETATPPVEIQATLEPAAQATPAAEEAVETAQPEGLPRLTVVADASADPGLIKSAAIYNGTKKVEAYDRLASEVVDMSDADSYARQPYGVMTYRGSSFRQNAAEGTVADPTDMEVLWRVNADSVKSSGKTVYYGIGWTGQPLIIKWSKEVREMSNIYDEKKDTKALREVIIAGEDGRIYFLDLETGEKTRASIDTGVPLRGTPSVHSLGFPLMSVGQYARKMAKKTYDIGLRVYNLLNSKQLFMIDGLDGKLDRPYYAVGSFETSSLIDYHSDTMISAGTNGMLYLTKLGTTIDRTSGTLTVNPAHVSLKTKASGEADKNVSVESSIAAYQNYVFYADMGGILRCVDTSSMKTLWAVNTGDAVEAAVALDLVDEGNTLWLYTANTLQNRKSGACQICRYNALTGELDWTYEVPVKKNSKTSVIPGAKASPVVGRNGLSDYVYFTVSLATDV
ncbi:MAG: hypothetical protein IJ708_01935, partial [Clostridia bacterium]|nr:hypothetical protein [Clostridia bacterium]